MICIGDGWVRAFGWARTSKVVRDHETLVLEGLAAGKNGDELLPAIEETIRQQYRSKDWADFDHLTVPVPMWALVVQMVFQIVIQIWFWRFAHRNEFAKYEVSNAEAWRRRMR